MNSSADGCTSKWRCVRRALGVAGVADEAEHLAGLDVHPVAGDRREGGEVRVVELVSLRVAQPEPVASDVVPADREDEPVGAGEDRRAERREDVVAVVPVPGDVAAEGAEAVAVRRRGRRRGRRSRLRSAAAAGRWASPTADGSCGRSWSARGQRASASALRARAASRPDRGRSASAPGRRSPARSPRRSRSGSPSRPAAGRAGRSGGRRARSRSRGSPACRRRRS